jgi:putative transcriptional regulator
VETSRGFVLHSSDFVSENSTKIVGTTLSLTSTRDVIESLAKGENPSHAGLFMGYSGWGAGQIEAEILRNGWLTVDADEALVLDSNHDGKWQAALDLLGINALLLSSDAGHA